MMDKKQVVIAILLIIAIVFSATSIIMNVSNEDFKSIKSIEGNAVAGNPIGDVQLTVENNPSVNSGGVKE